jgi:predicted membrane channel-forming protein YqfA (hemolysin III family)
VRLTKRQCAGEYLLISGTGLLVMAHGNYGPVPPGLGMGVSWAVAVVGWLLLIPDDWWHKRRRRLAAKLKQVRYLAHGISARRPLPA